MCTCVCVCACVHVTGVTNQSPTIYMYIHGALQCVAVCSSMKAACNHCSTLQHTALHCNTLQHTSTHFNTLQHTIKTTHVNAALNLNHTMGWLNLVGSIKLRVSFTKEPYKRDNMLQEGPIILSILLTIATP